MTITQGASHTQAETLRFPLNVLAVSGEGGGVKGSWEGRGVCLRKGAHSKFHAQSGSVTWEGPSFVCI